MYNKNIFASNLLRLMKTAGENQTDIAKLLGVSKSTVSAYCNATQIPRMDKVEILAAHFGVRKSELIEDNPAASVLELTPEEMELWKLFRAASPEKQAAIRALLK